MWHRPSRFLIGCVIKPIRRYSYKYCLDFWIVNDVSQLSDWLSGHPSTRLTQHHLSKYIVEETADRWRLKGISQRGSKVVCYCHPLKWHFESSFSSSTEIVPTRLWVATNAQQLFFRSSPLAGAEHPFSNAIHMPPLLEIQWRESWYVSTTTE